MANTRKEYKEEAFYTVVPIPGRRCELCQHYVPVPDTNPPSGLSLRVYGIVEALASCDHFELSNRTGGVRHAVSDETERRV